MIRGEVRWTSFPTPWGRRPALLVARDRAYSMLSAVMVAPLTTSLRDTPTMVFLDPEADGVVAPSVVLLDNVTSVRTEHIGELITTLGPVRMAQVASALKYALSL